MKGVLLPILAVTAAMAAFQVGAAFAKGLFPAIGPEGAATLRIGLGALMLLVLVRPWRNWPKRTPWVSLVLLGCAMTGAVAMFYQAINHLPLGVAMALQFLGPLSIAVFGSRRLIDLLWAGLGAAGVWCLVGADWMSGEQLDLVGVAWASGAAVSWASYIVLGRKVSAAFGASTASVAVTVAAIVMLPIGLSSAGTSLFAPELIPLALLVALFSTVVPFSLEFFAMPRMPAKTFAVFMSLEPAFGVLSGLVLLNEVLSTLQMSGIGLVILAAGGAAWWSRERKRPEESAPTDAPPN